MSGEWRDRRRLTSEIARTALVWAFTAALFGSSVSLGLTHFATIPAVHTPLHLPWPLFGLAFAVGNFAAVRLEFRNESHSLNLSDAVLLPAIAFTTPRGVVLAAVLGYLVRAVWVRQSLIKASFNVALHAFVAVVSVLCFHAVLGSAPVLYGRGWVAGGVVILAACVISDGAVQVVIGLSAGRVALAGLQRVAATFAVTLGAKAVLGFVALHVLADGPMAASLFVLSGAVIAVGYAAYGRLQARHATLEQLYGFDQALAGLSETREVFAAVLGETLTLLNAKVAQLIIPGPAGTEWFTLRTGDRAMTARVGPHPLAFSEAEIAKPVLVPRGAPAGPLRDAVTAAGFRDVAAVSVPTDGGPPHLLVVADRLGGDHVTFQEPDLALLGALAAHTAMALRSCRLLEELRREVEVKEHQAHHDALTGLANRALFSAALDRAVAERAEGTVVGVLLMDLDGFKNVNDTLGHDVGDALLQQMGTRLQGVVGGDGLIARLGGDEFAVVVPGAASLGEVRSLAERLCAAVKEPVVVAGSNVGMQVSVGVTVAPDHGLDRSTLLRRADAAMYQAKRREEDVAVYDGLSSGAHVGRPTLISALRGAIDTSTLGVHYQPKADLRSGVVTGAEALLRWTHVTYGPIGPDQAIPVAERSGLIRPLTLWVLDTALGELCRWRTEAVDLDLAVNLSPTLLGDPSLPEDVARLLAVHGVPPNRLTLELTESQLTPRPADEQGVGRRLAQLGVRLSIDDFGTGASSLARLRELPVSELKIDKSFVEDLVHDPRTASIVASTVQLAHDLGLTVVAEGVETREAWRQLRHLRCDQAQGYLLSRPLPSRELLDWYRAAGPGQTGQSNVIPMDVARGIP